MKTRKSFLLVICLAIYVSCSSQAPTVHDPVLIREGDTWYLFCTGMGISCLSSKDLVNWKQERPVFDKPPSWAVNDVPGFRGHIWAPDISFHHSRYYLYYSVSAFGKNTSCIGLATNATLDQSSPDYQWIDHGKVIQSVPERDFWNAIDPNLIVDEQGTGWLNFGSFWGGIKMVKLNSDYTGVSHPEEWYTLSKRPRNNGLEDSDPGNGAVEAPFIIKRGSYYYLFVSYDYCCRGLQSNYYVVAGRATDVRGPFLDREGNRLTAGGGTVVCKGNDQWAGVGHNGICSFNGTDYMVLHGYSIDDNGKPKLIVRPIKWTEDGWPEIAL